MKCVRVEAEKSISVATGDESIQKFIDRRVIYRRRRHSI